MEAPTMEDLKMLTNDDLTDPEEEQLQAMDLVHQLETSGEGEEE